MCVRVGPAWRWWRFSMSINQRAQYWAVVAALLAAGGCGASDENGNGALAGTGGVVGSGSMIGSAGMIGSSGGQVGGTGGKLGGAGGSVAGGAAGSVAPSTGGTGAAGMIAAVDAGTNSGVVPTGGSSFIREATPTSDSASKAG